MRSPAIDALGRIDEALRGAKRLDQALGRALQASLDVFDCDRAWLLYLEPGDGARWEIPIERTRPEYPGAMAGGRAHPADAASLELAAEVLKSEVPVVFDTRTSRPLPGSARRFGVTSQMLLPLCPRIGPPWMFGLHRCRQPRLWTDGEQQLFLAVRDRLGEALSCLLFSEKQQRAEERLRALLRATPDLVCFKDEAGRWLLANEATLAIFGLEGVEYAGRTDAELARECTRNRPALLARGRTDERAFLESGARRAEETLASPTGSPRVFDVLRVPLLHPSGDRQGLIALGRDITEQRAVEEELRRLEVSMQNAQKLESVGVLAGGLAHDFNNLLMGVMGYAGLALADTPEDAPSHEYLREVESAAERAAELASQMLAYSGRGRFFVTTFDLGAMVEEMLPFLRASISKKAALRISYGKDLPPVRGDVSQIRQVLVNLVTNASDAIGEEGGVIDVVLGTRHADRELLAGPYLDDDLPEGPYVTVEVSDSGSGMDEATVTRIFDPFFTTKASGRGLGMAAVLGIVRAHRGAIKIRSEPGVGTRFEVLLPVAEPIEPPAGHSSP